MRFHNLTRFGAPVLAASFAALNTLPALAQTTGPSSSQSPYLVPLAPSVKFTSLLTVGDTVPNTFGGAPYRMVGIPDGMGVFNDSSDTFTVLMNHELSAGAGIVRAHGANGAFISRYIIKKSDLSVVSGSDLVQNVVTWNPAASAYNAPAKGVVFNRLCSADLAAVSAYKFGELGTARRIFLSGEEAGAEGRLFAHDLDGLSIELPRLGKFSWENAVASPFAQQKTIVVGMDDAGGGQVYVYVGQKSKSGSRVQQAGLTNGSLFGVKVNNFPVENPALPAPDTASFTLAPLGNVENTTGADLETQSVAAGVTGWARPEDGCWDPNRPSDFYFVTTASFTTNSRLWRLRFKDINNPEQGGTVDELLDGSEGQKMMDNFTISKAGELLVQEDPGGQEHLAKIHRYDIASGGFNPVAQHDPNRFLTGSPNFLTFDEESSGIVPLEDVFGAGKFLLNIQAHYPTDAETVQGGQLLIMTQAQVALGVTQKSLPQPFQLPADDSNALTTQVRVQNNGSATLKATRVTVKLPASFVLQAVTDLDGQPVAFTQIENTLFIQTNTLVPNEERVYLIETAPQSAGNFRVQTDVRATGIRSRTATAKTGETIPVLPAQSPQTANSSAAKANPSAPKS